LVAGSGPLLAAVAIGILKAGGAVAAVVDLASPRDWLSRLPAMAARPDLLARGAAWVARLRLAGVPLLFGHRITEVTPTADGLRAAIGRVDAAGALVPGAGGPTLEMDAVAVGNGLVPSTDISRLLRVDHRFDTDSQGWCPVLDGDGRSARAFFYVAGDAGGIHGAVPAALQGELAGLAAAHDLGRLAASAYRPRAERLRRELARARRFGAAMAGLMAPRPGQLADIPAATVVCRCEDVTRAEIEDAARDGACDVNQLKAWTRCGMGPCQGRMCGDTAAALLALHHGTDRDAAGLFTGRTPLRPLPLDVLTGTYGYADLRLPPPAPL
jgi:bacterioferritin-associated ferredoxin